MSKIVEFRLGKGRTTRPGEAEACDRKYLELTVRLPEQWSEEGFQEALIRAEYLIDNYLGQPETPYAPAKVTHIPQLDTAEISGLVWTTYIKPKRKAEKGEAAWTFSDPERHGDSEQKRIVAGLVAAIKANEGEKLQLGDMEYSFSGDKKQFISRRPAGKQKSAR